MTKSQYEEWTESRDAPKPAPNNWPPKRIFAVALCVGFFGLIVAGAAGNHAEPAPQHTAQTAQGPNPLTVAAGITLFVVAGVLDAVFGNHEDPQKRMFRDNCHGVGGIFMGGVNGGDDWCDLRK
jgi:hypothetical protein